MLLRLRDCERGASLVELALTAPILATLVIGMIDISRAYSTKLQLEQGAQRTIEKAQENGSLLTSTYSDLQSEAATAAGVSTSNVTVTNYLACSTDGVTWLTKNSSTTAWVTDSCSTYSTTFIYYARYVSVDIQSSYSPFFSVRWAGSNADGSFTLHGIAGFRFQ
jgi:Flp pilus assembly protein TadG